MAHWGVIEALEALGGAGSAAVVAAHSGISVDEAEDELRALVVGFTCPPLSPPPCPLWRG